MFFGLAAVLSIPFWLVGALVDVQVLPGIPISALMFVVPGVAAAILTYRARGPAGVLSLLKRCVDFHRIRPVVWFVPILLLVPAGLLTSFLMMAWLGLPLPADPTVDWPMAPVLALVFFVSGAFEQVGWMGYAYEPLQRRYHALTAALILGAVWAVWHFVPLVQAGRAPGWIVWWTLGTVAVRVLMAWLFNHTNHSVAATILMQVMLNVGVAVFPNQGSHYDPMVSGIIFAIVAGVVAVATSPQTLVRRSSGEPATATHDGRSA